MRDAEDEKEWVEGVIVTLHADGTYTIKIGSKKEKRVEPDRVVEAPPPPGLPKSSLSRSTTRFVDKVCLE